jgi:hypothetical protein
MVKSVDFCNEPKANVRIVALTECLSNTNGLLPIAGLPTLAYNEGMPQYVCEFCKTPIIDITKGTYHMVRAWVKTGSNSNPRHIKKLYLYAHSVCAETAPADIGNLVAGETLFD